MQSKKHLALRTPLGQGKGFMLDMEPEVKPHRKLADAVDFRLQQEGGSILGSFHGSQVEGEVVRDQHGNQRLHAAPFLGGEELGDDSTQRAVQHLHKARNDFLHIQRSDFGAIISPQPSRR